MAGDLGRLYSQWRSTLLTCWAHCEAVIDFAEDEADVGEEQVFVMYTHNTSTEKKGGKKRREGKMKEEFLDHERGDSASESIV